MVVRISGAVIRLDTGEREFPGHLDQGDFIREGSVGVGIGVALPYGGELPLGVSLPWIAWRRAYRRTSGEGERSWETPLSLLRLMLPY